MDIKKRRCKKCGSSQTRIRITTKERICHTCGFIEKVENSINLNKDNKNRNGN